MLQSPLNAELINAVREPKAKTQPSPGAPACGSPVTSGNPEPHRETWSHDLPPNGVWQVELTAEDIAQMGILKSRAVEMAGVYTWAFMDDKAKGGFKNDTFSVGCGQTYSVVGEVLRFIYDSDSDCGSEVDDIQWRLDEHGLHLHLVAVQNAPFTEIKAIYEAKPWQKVE